MSLTRDPRVPKELTDEQKSVVERDPDLVELNHQRQDLVNAIKLEYGSVPKALGTDIHSQYNKLEKTIQSERRFLRKRAREEMREQFFVTIDTIEIDRQLLGLSISEDLTIDDGKIQFTCTEWAHLTSNLFRPLDPCETTKDAIHSHRLQVISDWSILCSLQGVPYKRRVSACGLKTSKMETDDPVGASTFPIVCLATQCLFCLGNDQLAYNARTYSFSRTDHLRRHVRDTHLRYLAPDIEFQCPHPACLKSVQGIMHFKNHAALTHKTSL